MWRFQSCWSLDLFRTRRKRRARIATTPRFASYATSVLLKKIPKIEINFRWLSTLDGEVLCKERIVIECRKRGKCRACYTECICVMTLEKTSLVAIATSLPNVSITFADDPLKICSKCVQSYTNLQSLVGQRPVPFPQSFLVLLW